MPYLENLNDKIAEAASANQERVQLIEKLAGSIDESKQSLQATQEEYVATERVIEGLIIARDMYKAEAKKSSKKNVD